VNAERAHIASRCPAGVTDFRFAATRMLRRFHHGVNNLLHPCLA
jgi:hypothetical protein